MPGSRLPRPLLDQASATITRRGDELSAVSRRQQLVSHEALEAQRLAVSAPYSPPKPKSRVVGPSEPKVPKTCKCTFLERNTPETPKLTKLFGTGPGPKSHGQGCTVDRV